MSTGSLFNNAPKRKKSLKQKKTKEAIIKAKPPLERIFGSKTHVKDHYFSDGSKVNNTNMRDVLQEASPFKYPDELDAFAFKVMSKKWETTERRKELKLKYNDRNNYITRHQRDMLNRLYVPTQDVKSAQTILDVDSEFYMIIEGRPIAGKFQLQDYIDNLRDIMRTKIVTGYRSDDSMLIEENLIEEQNMIDDITRQYNTYVKTFEEFLSKDHAISMDLLRASENEANKAFEKYEQYRELAKDFGMLKSQVNNLEEKWRYAKMYQKFLYLVSPMHWRKEHDFYHIIQKDDNTSVELAEPEEFFESSQSATEAKSLDDIIKNFMEDLEENREPLLYFDKPKELSRVFKFMELQNLNSLLHSEELATPLEDLKESMKTTEATYDIQLQNFQEIIDDLEGEILWEEDRARTLEFLARELINGEFKRLICDETALNLHVIVEDVYEARVAPNDANLTAYDMMKSVEMKYREWLLKLDYLAHEKVHKAEIDCYNEQTRIMKVALEASRKVIQIERLVKRLRRILEIPIETHVRELKYRSMQQRPKAAEKAVEQPITEEEIEYFHLFTDFCAEEDNIKKFRDIRREELLLEEQVKNEQQIESMRKQQAALGKGSICEDSPKTKSIAPQ
ncbi:PREDICTED: cilia- and flagella-associated protein 100-like [Nicrophorus vespilloides]|uniref:Cilia- and flagella-associated protein 100-like n=1 Tax=Nicrophorus vespilloides TaxID=110193 RepID=A0ABM1NHR7_NICVS|nr:PREDICTED: cilia- and flagella-associated protein 100-like [Nicrophorus vespilloides]